MAAAEKRQTSMRLQGSAETEEAKKRRQIAQLRLMADFRSTFSSSHGQRALRHIMDICGYQKVSIVGNPTTGDIHDRGTLYNEARRNIYIELRKLIHPSILVKVEFGEIPDN